MSIPLGEPMIEQYALSPLQHGMLFHQLQSGHQTGVDIEQLEGHLHESIRADLFRAQQSRARTSNVAFPEGECGQHSRMWCRAEAGVGIWVELRTAREPPRGDH